MYNMDIVTNKRIKDGYYDIEDIVRDMLDKGATPERTRELQKLLNSFFNANCERILYTENSDKLFFGIYVMPDIPANKVVRIITVGERYVVDKYYLELDSKLFDGSAQLNYQEITALLLHDITSVVNDSSPCEIVSNAIDEYLRDNKEVLKISSSVHYAEILSYGFRDAIRKCTTIFEKKEPEVSDTMADFYSFCNYKNNLISAFNKLERMGYLYNKETNDKFIVLSWTLRLYKDILHNRIAALMVLDRCEQLTPSKIEKREMENVAKRLNRIDDEMLIEGYSFDNDKDTSYDKTKLLESIRSELLGTDSRYTSFLEALNNQLDMLKLLQMKDSYGYNEPDATPDLLHQMNNKMAVIRDYVENNVTTKDEFRQLNDIYKELSVKRNQLERGNLYDTRKSMYNRYDSIEGV